MAPDETSYRLCVCDSHAGAMRWCGLSCLSALLVVAGCESGSVGPAPPTTDAAQVAQRFGCSASYGAIPVNPTDFGPAPHSSGACSINNENIAIAVYSTDGDRRKVDELSKTTGCREARAAGDTALHLVEDANWLAHAITAATAATLATKTRTTHRDITC